MYFLCDESGEKDRQDHFQQSVRVVVVFFFFNVLNSCDISSLNNYSSLCSFLPHQWSIKHYHFGTEILFGLE